MFFVVCSTEPWANADVRPCECRAVCDTGTPEKELSLPAGAVSDIIIASLSSRQYAPFSPHSKPNLSALRSLP